MYNKVSNHKIQHKHQCRRKPFTLSKALDMLNLAQKNHELLERNVLVDTNLITIDSSQKNPIIFAKDMNKFIASKSFYVLDTFFNLAQSMKINQISIGKNLKNISLKNDTKKKGSKGILRWDNCSFTNKEVNFKQELQTIKEKLKNKGVVKKIKEYRNKQLADRGKADLSNESNSSTDISECDRVDMFGNSIKKGGKHHKVCFSSIGDMNLVENWKINNKLLRRKKYNLNKKKGKNKRKCCIF